MGLEGIGGGCKLAMKGGGIPSYWVWWGAYEEGNAGWKGFVGGE